MVCVLVLMFCIAKAVTGQQDGPERLLYNTLMATYRKSVRPTYDPDKAIEVSTAFILKRINQLDERQQQLDLFGWLMMTWKDEYLVWNATDYNGTQRLVLSGEDIWLPEVAILNPVEDGTDLSVSADCRVSVTSEGVVFWPPGFQLRTTCQVNMRHFPFDVQTCYINFTNFAHNIDALTFTATASRVLLGPYQDNGEWELADTEAVTSISNSSRGIQRFPVNGFKLELRRRPVYYVINIVLPSVILTYISCLVFLLHPESGEKVSLSISVMLSFSLFLVLVSDIMPRTSDNLPYLGIGVVLSMTMTGVSLLVTIIILNVYNRNPTVDVPLWMRGLFLNKCSRLLCLDGVSNKVDDVNKTQTNEEKENEKEAPRENLPTNQNTITENETEAKYNDWQKVAMVIDRICLYVSFSYSTVFIMILFLLVMS